MKSIARYAALVFLAIFASFSVVYLQHRFDEGDRKSALRVVEEYRAPTSHKTIPEVMRKLHPNAALMFKATTESSCMQRIRVSALVQETNAATKVLETKTYEFIVDINRVHIGPGNELGRQALELLDRNESFSATAALASASASASAAPSPSPSISASK